LHYEQVARGSIYDETFKVAVSNRAWSITTWPLKGQGVNLYKQVCDGSIVTLSSHFIPYVPKSSTANKRYIGNDSTMWIRNGDIPDCTLTTIGMGQIWLAYASTCHYSVGTEGTQQILWPSGSDLQSRAFTTQATWLPGSEPPFLPIKADYFFDIQAFESATGRPARSSGSRPAVATPTKWATYETRGSTNVASLVFPLSFRYQQYEPYAFSGKPTVVYSYEGRLTDATLGVDPNALNHGFGEITIVEDERFGRQANGVAAINYVVTNRTIPSTTNRALERLLFATRITKGATRPVDPLQSSRWIVLIVMAATTAFFLVSFFRRGRSFCGSSKAGQRAHNNEEK
jgi:hypothetical protein